MNDASGISTVPLDNADGTDGEVTLFDRPMQQRVSPQLATQWLATVDPRFYRPVTAATVTQFAAAMRQDQWEATYLDPIRFDVLGRLRGGRMRLMALVESDRTIPMYTWTPPPCQPHEIIPGMYERHGKLVTAMRWNGDGGDAFDDLKRWVAGDPRQVASVERDATGCLKFHKAPYDLLSFWIYPGDWLVHDDDGYRDADHLLFAPAHVYRGPE